jgi:hypothetical protein
MLNDAENGASCVSRSPSYWHSGGAQSWRPGPGGLAWTVTMTLHAQPCPLRPASDLITRRAMPILLRWRQHKVEEAGNLPRFPPELQAEIGG